MFLFYAFILYAKIKVPGISILKILWNRGTEGELESNCQTE